MSFNNHFMHSLISIVISDNKMSWKLLKKIRNKCWHISRISIGDVRLLQAEILKKTETNAISRDDYNILHSITVNMITQMNLIRKRAVWYANQMIPVTTILKTARDLNSKHVITGTSMRACLATFQDPNELIALSDNMGHLLNTILMEGIQNKYTDKFIIYINYIQDHIERHVVVSAL